MNNISIEDTRKRAERYWYEDGIWEIGFGMVNLLLAGYFALARWVLAEQLHPGLLVALQMAALLGIFWMMGRVVRFLKERITYPRTGYVSYRRGPAKKRAWRIALTGLLSGGIAAGLALVSSSPLLRNSTLLITGVVISAMVVYLGYRFSLLRMFGIAALTLTLSAVLSLLPVDEDLGRVLFFGGYGLIFMLCGGLVLAGYLRRTQPPAEVPDYEAPASLEEN